jgi:hypothetical protein
MRKVFLIIFISGIIISCSSPLDRKFNETTLDKDALLIKDNVDTTEAALILGTILRYKFQSKPMEGLTYREILEEGKKFKAGQEKIEAEQKALAEEAKKAEEARIKRLNESLMVSLFNKGYEKVDYEDYITYDFVFNNKTSKDMVAFTGRMVFNDLFDKEIKTINITYDNGIAANSKVTYNATTDYNQFDDSDKALRYKELSKIKLVWLPEKIIFKDGSVAE